MGKTTISEYLERVHRLPVLDADRYAREAVEPHSNVLLKIADRYGPRLLQSDGKLDRRRLGDLVFGDSAERRWLEQQIHPYVRDRIATQIKAFADRSTIVLVIPLLFEARMTDLVTEIWVVRSPSDQQQQRIMERDRLNQEQVRLRIDSQMAIEQKAAQADVILNNSTTLEALFRQVDAAIRNSVKNGN